MEQIPLRDQDASPIDQVAPGVQGLRIIFVNVFALAARDGWVLVDAGVPGSHGRIRDWAAKHFGAGSPPQAILLTHGHFDHVGSLESLLKEWDVPVFAHPLEMPYLTGKKSYPPPDPSVGGGLMAVLSPLYPRAPKDLTGRILELPVDGKVPGLADWHWIHTPGHTPGHVSFWRENDRTLLVGDAFCTTQAESFLHAAIDQKPELSSPPAYYTPDWDSARNSVEHLAGLRPHTISPGHGQPMHGPEMERALQHFAAHFDALARPKTGTARG